MSNPLFSITQGITVHNHEALPCSKLFFWAKVILEGFMVTNYNCWGLIDNMHFEKTHTQLLPPRLLTGR